MARGLGTALVSALELTVPQVGSSSEQVSQQPFVLLPDGGVRKGSQQSPRTRRQGGVLGSPAPQSLAAGPLGGCHAAGAGSAVERLL